MCHLKYKQEFVRIANFVTFQILQNFLFKFVKCTRWTIFRANVILSIGNIEFSLSTQVQVIEEAREFQMIEEAREF